MLTEDNTMEINVIKEKAFENNEIDDELKCVPLGDEVPEADFVEVAKKPINNEDKILAMEQSILQIGLSLDSLYSIIKELSKKINAKRDDVISDNIEKTKSEMKIPEGTILVGVTKGVPYYCKVKDGAFYVGVKRYDTLSAAAEAVSQVRRNGWTFWKICGGKHDDKTVKEVFK